MAATAPIPVLEVGGSHVTAGAVKLTERGGAVSGVTRTELDPAWSAERILGALLAAAGELPVTGGEVWGIAMPGPFDYCNGVALFANGAVGKFASLHGIDMRRALLDGLPGDPSRVVFLNDAEAFGRGEYVIGAGRGYGRVLFLTLGSGVGSVFIDHGHVVSEGPDVPPGGQAYLIVYRDQPLEESVSRRAIRRCYAQRAGMDLDVHQIADLARSGDTIAADVLTSAMTMLGEAIGPWCVSFGVHAIVIGGAMSQSWNLLELPLRFGLQGISPQLASLPIIKSTGEPQAQLIGAALVAVPGAAANKE